MESAQLAAQLEDQFDLGIRAVDVVQQKARSRVYRLRGGARTAFLKTWIGSFSRERVLEEAALLDYLGERGFKAPKLVKSTSGGSIFEGTIEGHAACGYLTDEIRTRQAGLDLDDRKHLAMAARTLAEFHRQTGRLGEDFTGVRWNERWLIERNLQTLEPWFAGRRADFEAICRCFAHIQSQVATEWEKTAGRWGIVHGDWHARNVVLGEDGEVWFLDFESFGNGWRITDVMYLLGSRVRTEGPLDLEWIRDRYVLFMEEYSRDGPAIADASELPGLWMAVRLLLHFGRQIRESGQGRVDASQRDLWVSSFVEKIDLLAGA